MKKLFVISIMLLGFLSIQAQNRPIPKYDYFVLTRKIPQLKAIILAAQKLADQDGEQFGEFKVVICGQAVTDLTEENKIEPFIKMAKEHNVQLFACGFSLNKFAVDAQKIPADIQVVENGILYGFQLQKAGFYSLTL